MITYELDDDGWVVGSDGVLCSNLKDAVHKLNCLSRRIADLENELESMQAQLDEAVFDYSNSGVPFVE